MPMFTKLHSIRSSLSFSFPSTTHRSPSSPPAIETNRQPKAPSSSGSFVSVTHLSQQSHSHKQSRQYSSSPPPPPPPPPPSRHRTISTPTISFTETLRMISKQVHQDRFDDVFGSFFFTEKRCHDRAIFMAARLLHNLNYDFIQQHPATHSFWKTVIDRFYTLNYLLFVVPSSNQTRINYLAALEQQQQQHAFLKDRRGGMEIYFTVYYAAIRHKVLVIDMEQARRIVEHCLDSESKLGHAERDAMYIFHAYRAGFQFGHYYADGDDDMAAAAVMLDDDDHLLAIIQDAVRTNKNLTKQSYVNPFEDCACIVDSDDEDNDSGGVGGQVS